MKLKIGKDKEFAEEFASNNNLTLAEKDGEYFVEIDNANCNVPAVSTEDLNMVYRDLYREIEWQNRYLNERMDYIHERLSKHNEGHLPPIKSNEQMAKAIEALGLSEEYEVVKKKIYNESFASMNCDILR
jgi:hypothetical protein